MMFPVEVMQFQISLTKEVCLEFMPDSYTRGGNLHLIWGQG